MGPALSLDRSWPHDRSNADGPPSQHDGITLLTVIVYGHARVGSVVVFNSCWQNAKAKRCARTRFRSLPQRGSAHDHLACCTFDTDVHPIMRRQNWGARAGTVAGKRDFRPARLAGGVNGKKIAMTGVRSSARFCPSNSSRPTATPGPSTRGPVRRDGAGTPDPDADPRGDTDSRRSISDALGSGLIIVVIAFCLVGEVYGTNKQLVVIAK
jgi:hypothetical protein